MDAAIDHLNASCELLEVPLLRGTHRVFPEERNDPFDQVGPLTHDVSKQVLAVVVVPAIRYDLAHPEELLEFVEAVDALRSLRHRELVSHLIAGSVAASAFPARLPNKADREASFSV